MKKNNCNQRQAHQNKTEIACNCVYKSTLVAKFFGADHLGAEPSGAAVWLS